MRLIVSTPLALELDTDNVAAIRAEDETGGFGILPGHADFLTVLAVSVLSWEDTDGNRRHGALRGGVLRVSGDTVTIAAREAVCRTTLEELDEAVLEHFRKAGRDDDAARLSTARLHAATMRALQRYLTAARTGRDAPTGANAGGGT